MSRAVLSMGSNIGSSRDNIRHTCMSLALLPGTKVERVSSFYVTKPVGYVDQPDFINVAVLINTELTPQVLLGACLGIEADMGRLRPFKNSPRVIDIDLILFDDLKLDTPLLTIPHPRMSQRAFVLVPMLELSGDSGSLLGFDVAAALRAIDTSGVKKAEDYSILL